MQNRGKNKWAASWQNQQNGMCAQRRLRSAWPSAQSDQSSLSTWRKLGSLATHWVHSEDSDQPGHAQADLNLHWAHMPFYWFCHDAAQMACTNTAEVFNLVSNILYICTYITISSHIFSHKSLYQNINTTEPDTLCIINHVRVLVIKHDT